MTIIFEFQKKKNDRQNWIAKKKITVTVDCNKFPIHINNEKTKLKFECNQKKYIKWFTNYIKNRKHDAIINRLKIGHTKLMLKKNLQHVLLLELITYNKTYTNWMSLI